MPSKKYNFVSDDPLTRAQDLLKEIKTHAVREEVEKLARQVFKKKPTLQELAGVTVRGPRVAAVYSQADTTMSKVQDLCDIMQLKRGQVLDCLVAWVHGIYFDAVGVPKKDIEKARTEE